MIAAWVAIPGAGALLAARLGAWALAISLWLPWSAFVFPHGSTVIRDGGASQAAWPLPVAIALATIQWGVTALVFGWRTRSDPNRERFWSALMVVVAVAFVVRLGLSMSGYSVELSGP